MILMLIATVASLLLAAIMSVIAWRVAGDERRRSDARVDALAAEIHEDTMTAPVMPQTRVRVEELELRPARASVGASAPVSEVRATLFAAPPAPPADRTFVMVGGGVLVLAAAIAVAILAGGEPLARLADRTPSLPRSAPPAAAAAPAASADALPLELVALGHERVGDRLTVRGVVRNPPSGAALDQLTAVVVLFTPDNEFIASGRAAVAAPSLVPGGESAFTITVPGITDGAKYRISFRRDERIVPHLDKRHES